MVTENIIKPILAYEKNSLPYSYDLTSLRWANTNTSTNLDAVGIYGVANTASTSTDSSAVAKGNVGKSISITNDTKRHSLLAIIASDSTPGATRLVGIQLILSGGTVSQQCMQALDTQTGVLYTITETGTVTKRVKHFKSFGWAVMLSVANNGTGNVNAISRIYPSPGKLVAGSYSADNSLVSSCIVGHMQLNLNRHYPTQIVVTNGAAKTVSIARPIVGL